MCAAALKPRHGLLAGVYDTIGMLDAKELSRAFKSGRLVGHAGYVESVGANSVKLSDGTELQVRRQELCPLVLLFCKPTSPAYFLAKSVSVQSSLSKPVFLAGLRLS